MKKFFLYLFLVLISFLAGSQNTFAADKVKIAILPWKLNAPEGMGYLKGAMNDMLASRLGNEPLTEILKEGALQSALSQYGEKEITETAARELGKVVDADYVIYGSVTVIMENVSVDAKTVAVKKEAPTAFFTSQGKRLENLIAIVDELAKNVKENILDQGTAAGTPAQAGQSEYQGKFIMKEPAQPLPKEDDFIIAQTYSKKAMLKSSVVDQSMKYFDIGDTDGDGKNEVIMIDKYDLFIYRLEGQTLRLIKQIKGNLAIRNVSIAVADINKNNIPEIYLTRLSHDKLDSVVIEYKNKEYKTIATGLKWFIRILRDPDGNLALIGQGFHETKGFVGAVNRLTWDNGILKEGSPFDLPKELDLYNFVTADLDKNGKIDVVVLDERDYLNIYTKDESGPWNQTWKSIDFYGGSMNRIDLAAATNLREPVGTIEVKARVLYTDMDSDGVEEVIVVRNDPGNVGRFLKMPRSYDSSEMIDLVWQDSELVENWKTRKIDGYIAHYAVHDINNDGDQELNMLVVTEGGHGKSYIMSYPLKNLEKSNKGAAPK